MSRLVKSLGFQTIQELINKVVWSFLGKKHENFERGRHRKIPMRLEFMLETLQNSNELRQFIRIYMVLR